MRRDDEDAVMDHFAFYAEWRDLIRYCVPTETAKNQYALFEIAVSCFLTANKDGAMNATKSYGFGLVLESMVKEHSMIELEVVQKWMASNSQNEEKEVVVT